MEVNKVVARRLIHLLYIQERESISNKVWNLGKKEDFQKFRVFLKVFLANKHHYEHA